MRRKIMIFLLFCLFSVNPGLAANRPAQDPSPQPAAEARKRFPGPPQVDYLIGPGDIISVRVFQQPEMGGDLRVTAQGFIRILFTDEPIKASGLTEWQLADLITEKLRAVIVDPQVSVQVKEGRQDVAYILGAVKSPQAVPVYSDTRLLTLLAKAQGVNDQAGTIAFILRGSIWSTATNPDSPDGEEVRLSSVIETVDLAMMLQGHVELNKQIFPGDVVTIPEAGKVFVGGSVNKPDAFPMRGELTLTQAITLAGGPKPDAKTSKITIIRQEPNNPSLTEIAVNLGDIQKNPNTDIQLQAGDVVMVPSSMKKTLGIALLSSLAVQTALLPIYLLR